MTSVSVQAFLLCDSVVIDAQTGKTVIQGVFDKIFSQSFPAIHQHCALYIRLNLAEGHSCDVGIGVRSPSGIYERPMAPQRIVGLEGDVSQLIVQIQGLPVPAAGQYVLELVLDGLPAAQFRFTALPPPSGTSMGGGSHGKAH
jgi:hypothetical protein